MTSTFVKTVRNFITAGILVTSVSVPVFGQEIQVRPKTIHSDQFSRGWDVIVYPETNLYKCLDGKPVESWKDCHQFISEYLEAHPEKVNLQDQIAPSVQNFSSKVELESWVANIFVNNPEIKSFYFFTGEKNHWVEYDKDKGCLQIFTKINGLSGSPKVTRTSTTNCPRKWNAEEKNNQLNAVYANRIGRNF